ncbi:hypothetical protein [Prauserella shujinwangii]|uniref:hypothetical protein n=1 Tax=Prauserella shujinwangii TaxID=1453103 RepID=UPI0011B1ED58|nr:hypothetical protein [Prauserella shujinwangii]
MNPFAVDDMAIYPDVAQDLIKKCRDYRARKLPLGVIKAELWNAAQQTVAVEESELRRALQAAEGRLDILEHTVDSNALFDETKLIVLDVERRLGEYLG